MYYNVDGALFPAEDAFLSRLMETGATESSSSNICPAQMKEDREQTASEKTGNILHNIVVAINDLWCLKDGLYAVVKNDLPINGMCSVGKCKLIVFSFWIKSFMELLPGYGMCLVENVNCELYRLFFLDKIFSGFYYSVNCVNISLC